MIMVLVTVLMNKPTYVKAQKTEQDKGLVQRINYGVVFKKQSFLYLASESWLHTFRIDLPKDVRLTRMSMCNQTIHECSSLNNMLNFIHFLHDSTESQLLQTIRSIHTLVPQSNIFKETRLSRSLLPFIGNLAKGIFGLATMGDVNLLANHINALNARTRMFANALHQHGEHLSSFMNLVDNRTSNLMKGIQQNAEHIQKVTHNFYKTMSSFQQSMSNMSIILINLVNNGNILREKLNQLQSSIQSLVEGRISPFLIPKHMLTQTLHKIQRILTESHPGFYLTHFNPSYYYTHSNFLFARNHSALYITLRFPVSSHTKPLNLYKIISMPVPINHTSKHATKLVSLANYLAVTNSHDYYTTLTTDDLTNCVHGQTIFCPFNVALTPTQVPGCTIALFNNDVDLVNKHCNFRFFHNHLITNIVELTPTSVLVYRNNNTITLNCPDHQTLIPPCSLCIVNIPCKCSLSSRTIYFAPRLVECYSEKSLYPTNDTSDFSVLHPVNLALLTQFFDEDRLKHLLGDTTFPSQVTLEVPDFRIYSHNMSNLLAADTEQHLNLKKMALAAKKDAQIFQTLTEPLLTGDIQLQSEWPDLNAILIFITFTIGFLSFITCICLFYKVRKMATAMFILQQVSQAKSQTVPSFIYHAPTTRQNSADDETNIINNFISSEFSWIHASVVLSITVLVLLVIIMIFVYKKKSKKATIIALEITSGGNCVIVPVVSLSLCPSYWDITTPNIPRVTMSSFPSCKLFTTWRNFTITNKLTGQSIAVPSAIDVDFFTWRKLKIILSQPFCAYVVIIHHGYLSLLQNQQVDQSKNVNDIDVKEGSTLYPQL